MTEQNQKLSPSHDELEDLMLSCRYGDLEDVQTFVDRFGWTPLDEVRDESGNTILHMICGNGHLGPLLIDAHNAAGRSPLGEAELAGADDVAKWFVEKMTIDQSGEMMETEAAEDELPPNEPKTGAVEADKVSENNYLRPLALDSTMSDTQAQRPQQPAQDEGAGSQIWNTIQKVLLVYAASQLLTAFLKYKQPSSGPPTPGSVPVPTDASGNPVDPMTLPLLQALPAWSTNQNVSVHVYFSTSPIGDVFGVVNRKNWGQEETGGFPHWTWDNVEFGNWDYELRKDVEIEIPMAVRRNISSLWADIFLTKDGANPNPTKPGYIPGSVHHVRKMLTRYRKKPKVRKEHNLLSSKDEKPVEEEEDNHHIGIPILRLPLFPILLV
ncbi:hypothetical protein PIIN_04254 [Serendipita indica DSM 11827]|uniref:Uncharacterized protein n=1 Tax=Serendipita indica (strain DSM 11827) TaxID=1109443 RepID=G4TG72_SERID|nr:hypothetical protein PIIN_04254 [Serendipita indica DSM 11827]